MIFASTSFLYVFLPLFLLCYVLLPFRNLVALSFSLLFFTWGEGAYVLLLLATVGLNYLIGSHVCPESKNRALLLGAGVAANLLILGYFKYFAFVVGAIFQIPLAASDTPHLPLGISFFIFQSISYLVDVYRGDSEKARSFFDLALYIAMFPQLIAGPIVRYGSVAAALVNREITAYDVYRGAMLFVLGLSYKVLIANNSAEIADAVFALEIDKVDSATAWLGVVAYTLQIFFDFSGYSLMAIGIGRIMGFHFPQNFNYPYISQSITEFWRRWHMSLSSWFRDYLYIPLGGNRRGPVTTYRNLFIVFLLCGLWHGAAWTFVIWGLFHGLALIIERMRLLRILGRIPRPFRHVYTLLLVMVGWVLFRAETLGQAGAFVQAMFLPTSADAPGLAELASHENLFMGVIGCLLSLPIVERSRAFRHPGQTPYGGAGAGGARVYEMTLALGLLMLCSVYIMSGTYNPFIYFRF
jgi:alginate O-acetyltransferase complex protein AlgI